MAPTPASLVLTIGGVDVSAFVLQDSWSVKQQWGRSGSTAQFELYDDWLGRTSPNVIPQALQPVVLTIGGSTVFSGVITKPTFKFIGPNVTQWSLDCRDFSYLATMSVVTGDYSYMAADAIIRTVTQQANCGIKITGQTAPNPGIQPGPIVPRYRINYKQLTDVWDQMVKVASSNQIYGWYVDSGAHLNFYSQSQASNSGILFTDTVTAASTTTVGYIDRDTVKYEWDGQNLRNSSIVRGGNIKQTQTDSFVGNGSQTSWPLTFTVNSAHPAFKMTIGGVAFTVATQQEVQQSSSVPNYIANQNNSGQWFVTANSNPAANTITPAAGVPIVVKYEYEAPVVARVDDTTTQAKFRTSLVSVGASGVFQSYIADKNIKDIGSAKARARRELAEYSQVQEHVTFTVTEDWPGTIQAGQLFNFASQFLPDAKNNYALPLGTNASPIAFIALTVTIRPSARRANWLNFDIEGVRI